MPPPTFLHNYASTGHRCLTYARQKYLCRNFAESAGGLCARRGGHCGTNIVAFKPSGTQTQIFYY